MSEILDQQEAKKMIVNPAISQADMQPSYSEIDLSLPETLDERISRLDEIDKRINLIVDSVNDIAQHMDKEKQISKAKMEEAYKKFDSSINFVNNSIMEQIEYLEKMCAGAEHQGSSVELTQPLELMKARHEYLYSEIERISSFLETNK